jgi:hypothetical protein
MAKHHRRLDNDPRQLTLFDHLEKNAADARKTEQESQGGMDISARLRRALSEAIRKCPRGIHQVAGEMSHLLGETITSDMIYSWTAESKSQHSIWGSRLPAFCQATGDPRPIEILVEAAGRFCLPGPEALRAEIQRYSEMERKARAEKRKREVFLENLEATR